MERQITAAREQAQEVHNPALLDHLPVMAVDLEGMPGEALRQLFEVFRLEIRYDPITRQARCSITLSGDMIDSVARVTQEAMAAPQAPKKAHEG
jgi:hypothetical protein